MIIHKKKKKLSDETKYTELNNNKVTVLSSVRFTPENRLFIGLKTCATLKLEPVDKQFDLSSNLKRKDLQGESLDKENTPVKRLRTPAMKVKSNDKELIKIKKPQISVKFESSNKTAYDMKNKTEKRQNKVGTSQTDDFESKVREYESLLCENDKKVKKNEYKTGDTVLTRYYTKSWKYYVGVIENAYLATKKYTINYYKTIGRKGNVKFVVPKRKDQDCVPEVSIVKEIELLQINEDPDEYVLMNDSDEIYF
ncbi:unnamed protein product [Parnassius apollo]|uniref:(apollo) hypothetical protein n=1 Tax=Parnassius apollo TaxID=110799 RepID=A0A8S3YGY8_PARAO|nr:unnamed protein product [Parnassius apollo]